MARDWLAGVGFTDARLTGRGPDLGIDVIASGLVAQVKAEARPVTRPVVQAIAGVAAVESARAAVFALSGFTAAAEIWGDRAEVALFTFDLAGDVRPFNRHARALLNRAALHPALDPTARPVAHNTAAEPARLAAAITGLPDGARREWLGGHRDLLDRGEVDATNLELPPSGYGWRLEALRQEDITVCNVTVYPARLGTIPRELPGAFVDSTTFADFRSDSQNSALIEINGDEVDDVLADAATAYVYGPHPAAVAADALGLLALALDTAAAPPLDDWVVADVEVPGEDPLAAAHRDRYHNLYTVEHLLASVPLLARLLDDGRLARLPAGPQLRWDARPLSVGDSLDDLSCLVVTVWQALTNAESRRWQGHWPAGDTVIRRRFRRDATLLAWPWTLSVTEDGVHLELEIDSALRSRTNPRFPGVGIERSALRRVLETLTGAHVREFATGALAVGPIQAHRAHESARRAVAGLHATLTLAGIDPASCRVQPPGDS
ncbi:MAG: restriction endonuclease [Actinomycetota bacterium]|nr:restriction endonuclease [Actinomycetota bacterium]